MGSRWCFLKSTIITDGIRMELANESIRDCVHLSAAWVNGFNNGVASQEVVVVGQRVHEFGVINKPGRCDQQIRRV